MQITGQQSTLITTKLLTHTQYVYQVSVVVVVPEQTVVGVPSEYRVHTSKYSVPVIGGPATVRVQVSISQQILEQVVVHAPGIVVQIVLPSSLIQLCLDGPQDSLHAEQYLMQQE